MNDSLEKLTKQRSMPLFGIEQHTHVSSSPAFSHCHLQPAAASTSSLILALPFSLTSNNGVAHVLEHMLLAKSMRHVQRSLFFKIHNQSQVLDSNALTTNHALSVHFTTQNQGEVLSILKLYLDALLWPDLNHQQFTVEVGDPQRPGVVVNEVRGYFANPLFVLKQRLLQGLFNHSPLAYNSGGDPELITTLKLSDIKAFWQNQMHWQRLFCVSYGKTPSADITETITTALHDASHQLAANSAIAPANAATIAAAQSQPCAQSQLDADISETYAGFSMALGELVTPLNTLQLRLLEQWLLQQTSQITDLLAKHQIQLCEPLSLTWHDDQPVLLLIFANATSLTPITLSDIIEEVLLSSVKHASQLQRQQVLSKVAERFIYPGNFKHHPSLALSQLVLQEQLFGIDHQLSIEPQDLKQQLQCYAAAEPWQQLIALCFSNNPKRLMIIGDARTSQASSLSTQSAPATRSATKPTTRFDTKPNTQSKLQPELELEPELSVLSKAPRNQPIPPNHLGHFFQRYQLTTQTNSPTETSFCWFMQATDPSFWQHNTLIALAYAHVAKDISLLNAYRHWLTATCHAHGINAEISFVAKRLSASQALGLALQITLTGYANDPNTSINALVGILRDSAQLKDNISRELTVNTASSLSSNEQRSPLQRLIIHALVNNGVDDPYIQLAHALDPSNSASTTYPCSNILALHNHVISQARYQYFVGSMRALQALYPTATAVGHPTSSDSIPSLFTHPDQTHSPTLHRQQATKQAATHHFKFWSLGQHFGQDYRWCAALSVLCEHITAQYLEPVLREQMGAYGVGARVMPELDKLVFFALNSPHLDNAEAHFSAALQHVLSNSAQQHGFNSAKRRALLQFDSKQAQNIALRYRCQDYSFGYDDMYQASVLAAITALERPTYQAILQDFFATQGFFIDI